MGQTKMVNVIVNPFAVNFHLFIFGTIYVANSYSISVIGFYSHHPLYWN